MRVVILGQRGFPGLFEQFDGTVDVLVDTAVDRAQRFAGLSARVDRRAGGVNRYAGLVPARSARQGVVGGAGEPRRQVQVAERPDGVGLSCDVGHVGLRSGHFRLGVDDVVYIGDPFVVGVPDVVRPEGRPSVVALDVVAVVAPEPAVALRLHDQVVGHAVERQVVGRDAEALVGVCGRGPSGRPHRAVDAVDRSDGRGCRFEQFLARTRVGRGEIEHRVAARGG